MIPTDAGFLFALCDPVGQPDAYSRCAAVLAGSSAPMVTTWAALAEVYYLTGKRGGISMQRLLARFLISGQTLIHELSNDDFAEMNRLMEKYADVPMDLADASLIIAADQSNATRIFSLDSDFYIYRTATGGVLEVLPGPARP